MQQSNGHSVKRQHNTAYDDKALEDLQDTQTTACGFRDGLSPIELIQSETKELSVEHPSLSSQRLNKYKAKQPAPMHNSCVQERMLLP